MHPSTERAYELLERLADFEVTPRDPTAPDVLEAWDSLKQRSAPPTQRHEPNAAIVYKAIAMPQAQQQAATMDAEASAKWNAWAANIANDVAFATFDKNIRTFADVIAEEVKRLDWEMHDKLQAEIDKLRNEVTLLRAEMDGTVKQLRGRDADAA